MIIARLMGGLGNQMFCYAAARSLAERLKTEVKLDLSDYPQGFCPRPKGLEAFPLHLGIFHLNVTGTVASASEISALRDRFVTSSSRDRLVRLVRRLYPNFLWPESHVREKSNRFDESVLQLGDNCYLSGFWQSEQYFSDAREVIRREFTFRDPQITEYAGQYIKELKEKDPSPIVSLHVRRGDLAYASENLNNPGIVYGPPVTLDYIHSALARFGSGYRFLVFSNSTEDLDWCRKNISYEGLLFCEGHSDVVDLALMSTCDHHIIANSSFSWWAAWLNQNPRKQVIAPRKWFGSARPDLVIDDLIPPTWTVL